MTDKSYLRDLSRTIIEFREAASKLKKKLKEKDAERAGASKASRFVRTAPKRVRVFPWVERQLELMANMRAVKTVSLYSSVLSGIAYLWSKYPEDEFLYLKRVDYPHEADTVVGPYEETPVVVSLGVQRHSLVRMLSWSVMALLQEGVAVAELQEWLNEIVETYVEEKDQE